VDRLLPFLVSLILLLFALPANAATVAIVQSNGGVAGITETVSRLHGELISVGLEVEMISPPQDSSPDHSNLRPWVEKLAAAGGIDAVINVVGDDAPSWVDVWVIERSPRRLELWRVASEPDSANESERLAIRAIEVLRSSFLEGQMSGEFKRRPSLQTPELSLKPGSLPNALPKRQDHIGIGLGIAALSSMNGLGPAFLPVILLDTKVNDWVGIHAQFAGFGSRSTVATAAGSARIAEQYGLFGGTYRFRAKHWFGPFVSLSVGALRTSVLGEANVPNQGHGETHWSFLVDGGIGTELRLSGRYYLSLAGHVQLAQPYLAVHIVDSVVATSGQPNLVLTLTVGAWL